MVAEKKKAAAKKAAPKDKAGLKKKLKELKAARTTAVAAKEGDKLESIRRRYRRTTLDLRRLAPPKGKKVKAE